MFQNTLLIIKADYMHERRAVLLHLIDKGFMIQAQRRIQFTPEDAAEFYKDKADAENFMVYVIMLSKGVSEAFILTKQNAVEELLNTMICYFTTSIEVERWVHVTKHERNVQSEISFIFPNYIHDPIPYMNTHQFQSNSLLAQLVGKLYEVVQSLPNEKNKSWRVQVAEWLMLEELPIVMKQCNTKPTLLSEEKGLQVKLSKEKPFFKFDADMPSWSFSSPSIWKMTSTSCSSCNEVFDMTQSCADVLKEKNAVELLNCRKTYPLFKKKEKEVYMAELYTNVSKKHLEGYEAEQDALNEGDE